MEQATLELPRRPRTLSLKQRKIDMHGGFLLDMEDEGPGSEVDAMATDALRPHQVANVAETMRSMDARQQAHMLRHLLIFVGQMLQ